MSDLIPSDSLSEQSAPAQPVEVQPTEVSLAATLEASTNQEPVTNPSLKNQLGEQLSAAKTTGSSRASRIQTIFTTAVTEALREVKRGSQDFQAIAQDSFSTVVDTLADEPPAPEASFKQRAQVALRGFVKQAKTQVKSQVASQAQQQWTKVDAELHQRYGDRYSNLRQKAHTNVRTYVENIPGWRDDRRQQEQTPLQQQQLQLEVAAGDLGSQVAQQETQLRQQVKQWVSQLLRKP